MNTPTEVGLTKVDILYPEARGVTDYSNLPEECKIWIDELEQKLDGLPITLIKTGPEIYEIIDLREEKGTI